MNHSVQWCEVYQMIHWNYPTQNNDLFSKLMNVPRRARVDVKVLLTQSYYIVLNDLGYSTSNMNCFYDTFMVLLHLFKLKNPPIPLEAVSDSKLNHIWSINDIIRLNVSVVLFLLSGDKKSLAEYTTGSKILSMSHSLFLIKGKPG